MAQTATTQNPPPPGLEPVKTTINVTDTVTTESPSPVVVETQTDLEANTGVNLDDRLRSVPGFQLFRRTSSVVAHPTTQGVSLRGIGSTGASRTLLLWDGIPLNDPFGGWVYWDRVNPDELERVELTRDASTSVFGNDAMAGVISLFSEPPRHDHEFIEFDGGNLGTEQLSSGFADLWGRWGASVNFRGFNTTGYYIVPENIRGAVDQRSALDFYAGDTRLDYLGDHDRFFLRFDILAEHRNNGTILQRNGTGLGEIAANYTHTFTHDQVSVLSWREQEQFRGTFSSVNANRTKDTLSYHQTVPSDGTGAAAMWSHDETRWQVLTGADYQRAEGWSHDQFPAFTRISGGIQNQGGAFAQGQYDIGGVRLFAGLRGDVMSGGNSFVAPSGGVAVRRGIARFRASVFRGFRAPTLNELYRQFRTGNVTTLANAQLRPETLIGGEAGIDLLGEKTRASFTYYHNALSDLITNVTLKTTPTAITRQRQNAAAATAQGVEADIRRQWGNLQGTASYLFADSVYSNGNRVPQVARHQGSAQLAWVHRNTLIAGTVRAWSSQYDDDLNQFLLPGYASVSLSARQRIIASLSAVAEVENLLDRVYYVQFSPTPNTGTPRFFRFGLRWER
ncbi:MAG TPA: TonB-dependent receptor [Bryobacteraceae bacterium]|nr:TonB-dependent receptor [Bryobacteraceae bacterium]